MTAKLYLANTASGWEAIDSRQVAGLSFPSRHQLTFPVSGKPATYRIDVVFRNGSSKKLAKYGEYFRVVRPQLNVELALDRPAFYPGETVAPWLENHGTEFLFFGLPYSIEVEEGGTWAKASISPPGPWLLIGLSLGPGGTSSCWKFQTPQDAPSGLYRFVWQGTVYRYQIRGRGKDLTRAVEFQILPRG